MGEKEKSESRAQWPRIRQLLWQTGGDDVEREEDSLKHIWQNRLQRGRI